MEKIKQHKTENQDKNQKVGREKKPVSVVVPKDSTGCQELTDSEWFCNTGA